MMTIRPRRFATARGLLAFAALLALTACKGSITETALAVLEVVISGAQATLPTGQSMQLQAIPTSASGQSLTARPVAWSSSNDGIATVSGTGLVTAITVGPVQITASSGTASANVNITITPGARIALSANTADFLTAVGGSTGARTITITNAGSGVLSNLRTTTAYGSTGSGWLTASLSSTTAPSTLSLSANAQGLGVGVYTATVSVLGNNATTETIAVSYTVTPAFTLTVTALGHGSGSITGNGINCTVAGGVTSGTCSVTFSTSTNVTLTATSAGSSAFGGWSGGCTGTGTCQVTVSASRTVLASFTAPCSTPTAYTLGSTITSSITISGCESMFGGEPLLTSRFAYTVASQALMLFTVSSGAFAPVMAPIVPAGGGLWYENLTVPGAFNRPVLARAGSYTAVISSFDDAVGSFTLGSTSITGAQVTECTRGIFATQGVTGSFTVTSSCPYAPGSVTGSGFNGFPVYVNMSAGPFRVSVTATAFSPLLEIRDVTNSVVATSSGLTGSTVSATYSAQGPLVVWVTSRTGGQSGAFSITIDP